jgi:flagellar hook-basal body complex protein FliE
LRIDENSLIPIYIQIADAIEEDILNDKLNEVNELQVDSENATEDFINGEDIDIHQVMLSAEEAKMSIQLAVQIRNKIVEAYQEINRMQL